MKRASLARSLVNRFDVFFFNYDAAVRSWKPGLHSVDVTSRSRTQGDIPPGLCLLKIRNPQHVADFGSQPDPKRFSTFRAHQGHVLCTAGTSGTTETVSRQRSLLVSGSGRRPVLEVPGARVCEATGVVPNLLSVWSSLSEPAKLYCAPATDGSSGVTCSVGQLRLCFVDWIAGDLTYGEQPGLQQSRIS